MESKNTEILKLQQTFEELITKIFEKDNNINRRIDEVERNLFKTLLSIGKEILTLYIKEVIKMTDNTKRLPDKSQNKGLFPRTYYSIFGKIRFVRKKIYHPEKKKIFYPADRALSLPREEYSYNLQDWIGYSATDTDFRSSIELINKIFDYDIKEMQAERISNKLSEEVDEFYNENQNSPIEEEGAFFAGGFDDKGVHILPWDAGRKVEGNGVRLGKGQKKGIKKSCTVSLTYSFDPNKRTPEDVVASVFKEKSNNYEASEPSGTHAKNKHIRAFMSDKQKAIDYGFDNLLRRSMDQQKNIVVLIDGDRGLEKAIDRTIEAKGIQDRVIFKVLDFIHVVEYLWKAANIHFGEKSSKRITWVKEQSLLLLQDEINEVLNNLQGLIKDRKYKTSKYETIKSVIKYLTNHKHMLNYKECLSRGFPISTGAIESACGHFVQSRMERNGMRWSMKGAINMLNLRAVRKNKNWETYMEHHIKEQLQTIDFVNFKSAA